MLFDDKELVVLSFEELLEDERMQKYIRWKKTHRGDHKLRLSRRLRGKG
jgi:hypothetical protein